MTVEYRLILDYDDYRAGNDGSIWNEENGEWVLMVPVWMPRLRPIPFASKKKWEWKSHAFVILHKNGNSKEFKEFAVAELVLMAFVGPMPKGMFYVHKNDNTKINKLSNLKWGTRKDFRREQLKKNRSASAGMAKTDRRGEK